VNFDSAQHVFIEGENLEVLKVLQKAYFGKVNRTRARESLYSATMSNRLHLLALVVLCVLALTPASYSAESIVPTET
jgi:hypothetical protein